MKKKFSITLYYFLIIMYFELCHKFFIYHNIFDMGLFYTLFFSLLIAILLSFFTCLGKPKTNKKIMITFTLLLTFIFIGNFIYQNLFSVPFTIRVTSMAGQALDFANVIFGILLKSILPIFLFFLPFIFLMFKKSKLIITKIFYFEKKRLLLSFILLYLFTLAMLLPFKNLDNSAFRLYFKQDNLSIAIKNFGLLTSERIDIQRAMLGFEPKIEIFEKEEEKKEVTYNKLNIDFEKLIAQETNETIKSVYTYFQNENSTNQNEYTGKYKGKNLIFILAESFNSFAVSKTLTPTLYRLTHTGFQFNNFYSPVFLSTTGGEFQAMTGLVPSTDTLNEWYKGNVSLPFAIGNALKQEDYQTFAYHNYEATFYNRTNTMPTLGFENYYACLNGLEEEMECNWVDSNAPDDKELIEVTFDRYKDEEKFVTYYITMSGHFPYNYVSSKRNYEKVKNLPYSNNVKSYLATQIDLDNALKELIDQLEKQNILDDTVICLVGDHYPYALSLDEINEVANPKRDEQFEIHRSNLILWNNEQEAIEINKTAGQIDILPTLLNLFGIEYDSRLMIGHDILSEKEGLVIFSDMSWITDYGYYNANTKAFKKKNEAIELKENYVTEINRWVNNSVNVSKKIILNDIYKKIIESIGE